MGLSLCSVLTKLLLTAIGPEEHRESVYREIRGYVTTEGDAKTTGQLRFELEEIVFDVVWDQVEGNIWWVLKEGLDEWHLLL